MEASWGAYKVKADELIIYVRTTDGEFYTIKGKETTATDRGWRTALSVMGIWLNVA